MGYDFQSDPGFREAVVEILTDPLGLPQTFMDYTVQYAAMNPLPIPITQVTGFTQFTVQPVAAVNTQENTLSATYTDLATVGPVLTGIPDGKYLILFGCNIIAFTTNFGSYASVKVNATEAIDADSIYTSFNAFAGLTGIGASRAITKSLANGGSNTLTMRYRVDNGGTGGWGRRWILALKYANN